MSRGHAPLLLPRCPTVPQSFCPSVSGLCDCLPIVAAMAVVLLLLLLLLLLVVVSQFNVKIEHPHGCPSRAAGSTRLLGPAQKDLKSVFIVDTPGILRLILLRNRAAACCSARPLLVFGCLALPPGPLAGGYVCPPWPPTNAGATKVAHTVLLCAAAC